MTTTLKVAEQGDANFFFVTPERGNWFASIQLNGEMTVQQQRAALRTLTAAPQLYAALNALQANPNDPLAHRHALDALALAGGDAITTYYQDRAKGAHADTA